MITKNLIILNSPILFEILDEIKENLNLNIINMSENEIDKTALVKYENFVLISNYKNNYENCIIINSPLKINKILEQINVEFLSNQYLNQSKISIGNYNLDLNARIISKGQAKLNLTERETELILYINMNSPVSLKILQEKVWKHSDDIETHTVETHVYRLRKKFLEKFKDDKFINHDQKGYFLN